MTPRKAFLAGALATFLTFTITGAGRATPTAYDLQQDARISALEGTTPTPVPTVAPTAIPASGVLRSIGPSSSASQFASLASDLSVDVIELQAGTYRGWHAYIRADRSTRPLEVRPCSGCQVIFDDTGGTTGAGLFYLGANVGLPGYPTSATGPITFQGPFTVRNYTLGQAGVVYTGWVRDLTLNGFDVQAKGSAGTSHALYVSSDDSHRSQRITANGWTVTSDRTLAAVQVFHSPSVDGLIVQGWNVSNVHRAAYLWADPTGIVVDGWTISNSDATFDTYEQAAGVIRNSNSTGSGPMAPGQGYWVNLRVTDGGGNSSR